MKRKIFADDISIFSIVNNITVSIDKMKNEYINGK